MGYTHTVIARIHYLSQTQHILILIHWMRATNAFYSLILFWEEIPVWSILSQSRYRSPMGGGFTPVRTARRQWMVLASMSFDGTVVHPWIACACRRRSHILAPITHHDPSILAHSSAHCTRLQYERTQSNPGIQKRNHVKIQQIQS